VLHPAIHFQASLAVHFHGTLVRIPTEQLFISRQPDFDPLRREAARAGLMALQADIGGGAGVF
jgi:hypothetical protein